MKAPQIKIISTEDIDQSHEMDDFKSWVHWKPSQWLESKFSCYWYVSVILMLRITLTIFAFLISYKEVTYSFKFP